MFGRALVAYAVSHTHPLLPMMKDDLKYVTLINNHSPRPTASHIRSAIPVPNKMFNGFCRALISERDKYRTDAQKWFFLRQYDFSAEIASSLDPHAAAAKEFISNSKNIDLSEKKAFARMFSINFIAKLKTDVKLIDDGEHISLGRLRERTAITHVHSQLSWMAESAFDQTIPANDQQPTWSPLQH